MKKVQRVISTALFVAVLASFLSISSFAAGAGDFTIENGVLTGYIGSGGDVVIPDGVTKIGEQVFYSMQEITSVTIPASVTQIGEYNFNYCDKLTQIAVDSNNASFSSIDGVLFKKDKTKLVAYPGGKTGDYSIPAGVTYVYSNAFAGCMGQGGSLTIPSSMTQIGEYAFYNCGMDGVSIPDSITSIGGSAFNGCYYLSSVTIPGHVSKIGEQCFRDCTKLTQISVASGNTAFSSIDGVLFAAKGAILMQYPCGKEGASYTLPDSVTAVVTTAFMGSGKLAQILVGSGNKTYYSEDGMLITKSGSVLWCCPSGKTGTIKVPGSVSNIASCAFGGEKTTGVIIPSGVAGIDGSAFAGCDFSKLTIYGAAGSYAQSYAKVNSITFKTITTTAVLTKSTVTVNGTAVSFEAYNIDGSNYLKLRDIAKALGGTAKQFEVGWDGANNAISLTTGKVYTAVGGELTKSGGSSSKAASISSSGVYVNGTATSLTAYNIDGNNYFKLRDVAAAIDFGVAWNAPTSTIGIDTSTGYTA